MRGLFNEGQAEVPDLSPEEWRQRVRSWKVQGIAQLALASASVVLVLAARYIGSFILLAAGLVCLFAAMVLTLMHLRCPVCGREIRKWERYFGTLGYHCPNCGFSIHSGKKSSQQDIEERD